MVNALEIILPEEKLREGQVCILKQRNFEKRDIALQSLKSYLMWN